MGREAAQSMSALRHLNPFEALQIARPMQRPSLTGPGTRN
jgi:hypothetical protein